MTLLHCRLSVDYPKRSGVLRDVEIHLQSGEIVGLVGASGAGKSTLLLALLGLLDRTARIHGSVQFAGRELLTLSRRQWRSLRGSRIALVPQSPLAAFNPWLRIRTHFEEAWRAHSSVPFTTQQPRILSLLENLGLENPAELWLRYPSQMSVGQAQRLILALALLHGPELILADEPASALDPIAAAEALQLLRRINQDHSTAILLVTHDLASAAGICHRIVVMQAGQIVESGATSDIFRSPRQAYTRALVAAVPRIPNFETTCHSFTGTGGDNLSPPLSSRSPKSLFFL
jgi:ABC-type glutathione transport system ATPase component